MKNLETFFIKNIIPKYHEDILISCNSHNDSRIVLQGNLSENYFDCKRLLDSLFYYGVVSCDFYTQYCDIIFNDYKRISLYVYNLSDKQYKLFINLTKLKYSSIIHTESILKDSNNNN